MNNFLNYPIGIKPISLGLGRDVRGYMIAMDDDKHWEKENPENLFAIVDDRCTSSFLKCSVNLLKSGAEFTLYGLDRLEKAEALIDAEFELYSAKKFPVGLHVVTHKEDDEDALEYGIYLGKMLLAAIRPKYMKKTGELSHYIVVVRDMHRNKFFTDISPDQNRQDQYNLLLNSQLTIKPSDINKSIKLILKFIDLERYEKNKKAAEDAKKEEQQANNQFLGLPELTGTEKQVKWANDLRMKFIQAVGVDAIASKQWKKTTHKAKFWIDHRDNSYSELRSLVFLKTK